MKRFFSLFGLSLLLGSMVSLTHAEETELTFAFERSCEETESACLSEIDVEEEVYVLQSMEEQKIDLLIKNPQKDGINSYRLKLSFNPEKLLVTQLNVNQDDFSLREPNADKIDVEDGVLLLGGAIAGASRNDEEFLLASVVVKPLQEGAELNFVNFQKTELADTGIFQAKGIDVSNLLQTSPKPLRFGADTNEDDDPVVDPTSPVTIDDPDPVENTTDTGLTRPQDLYVQTDPDGKVRLLWRLSTSSDVKGYYLYYSNESGMYIRRKDVGRTNFAELTGLTADKKYYFALTAYGADGRESDYSDEVSVIVGQPGTESHPFVGDPFASGGMGGDDGQGNVTDGQQTTDSNLDNVDENAETGSPLVFAFAFLSLGGAFLLFALRRSFFFSS